MRDESDFISLLQACMQTVYLDIFIWCAIVCQNLDEICQLSRVRVRLKKLDQAGGTGLSYASVRYSAEIDILFGKLVESGDDAGHLISGAILKLNNLVNPSRTKESILRDLLVFMIHIRISVQ